MSDTSQTAPHVPSATSISSPLPHIHLLCMHSRFADAFTIAVTNTSTSSTPFPFTYTIHDTSLSQLPSTVTFDLLVSPANSYGLLDGSFDDAISRAISPRGDYYALTRHVQRHLHPRWRGYLPPGHTEIIPLPTEWSELPTPTHSIPGQFVSHARPNRNVWSCRYLALCPTMRVPVDVTWDREVVYECTWTLLCAVDRHNMEPSNSKIRSLLMAPFATGVGGVSPRRWAEQTVVALRQFAEARREGSGWDRLDWATVDPIDREVEATWMTER